MFDPFTLVIPVDPRFHALASDVAGRFAELAGGSAAGVSSAVTSAVEAIAAGAGTADQVQLTFRLVQKEVGVDLRCGSRTQTITCPL